MKTHIQVMKTIAFALLVAGSVIGCSTWKKLDGTEKGAVIGGGTGALIGNTIAPGVGGTVVGGAAGAIGGGMIGHEMDDDKRRRY